MSIINIEQIVGKNLLDFHVDKLKNIFEENNLPSFRVSQIFKWILKLGVFDFDLMTDINKTLRKYLKDNTYIKVPSIVSENISEDKTIKWLLELEDRSYIELVFIPQNKRGTLCLSSQVGCIVGCNFCATGLQGFKRNLKISEIIGQVLVAVYRLKSFQNESYSVTNVVFMGMGEPLLNLENVKAVVDLLLDPKFFSLSKRKVTISTSGIVPAIYSMIDRIDTALAVSLHSPFEDKRSEIMPINDKYSLAELVLSLKAYQQYSTANRDSITIEYLMLSGINDRDEDAIELVRLLKGVRFKVNLIPWNFVEGLPYIGSSEEQINRFAKILISYKIIVTVRRSRGSDINSACGQLVGSFITKKNINRSNGNNI